LIFTRRMYLRLPALFVILVLCLAACEPEATPFPVDIPATIALTSPAQGNASTDARIVRYALSTDLLNLVPDLDVIEQSARIEQLNEPVQPQELGQRYDIAVTLGEWSDAVRLDNPLHVSLVVNNRVEPLTNPTLADAVRKAINSQSVISALNIPGAIAEVTNPVASQTLRTELANAGWPDGFELSAVSIYTLGAVEAAEQLTALGITTRVVPLEQDEAQSSFQQNQFHLAFISWTSLEQRGEWAGLNGEENVIDMYTLPISYWAVPELKITLTENGWPLATW
jgi:uncharacterized protein YeaC (DUF1315 family)